MTTRAPSVLRETSSPALRWARRLAISASLVASLACAGPLGCASDVPLQQKVVALDPLPAPAGLLADVFIPNPDAAWAKARTAVGGPAMFLPATAGALAATFLGLPGTVSGEIDGQVPVVGAMVEDPGGKKPLSALGLHVRAGERLVDQLTKGEAARFVSRVDEKTTITLLEPKGGGQRPVALGILGNYLLVAQTLRELTEVGPYVARTLPGAKMPKDDLAFELPQAALAGPVTRGLRESWESLRPKQTTDAGATTSMPSPIEGVVERLFAIMGDLDHARVTVNLDDKAARVRLAGTPKPGAGASSSMEVGDPRRVLELPVETEVAIYERDSAEPRAGSSRQYAGAFARALGSDVPAQEQAAIEAAFVRLAEGRGDTFVAGLSVLPTGPAGYLRSEVSDGDKLRGALDDLFDLAKLPSVKTYLGESGIGVTTGSAVIENLDAKIRRARFARTDDKAKGALKDTKTRGAKADPAKATPGTPASIDVLYTVGKEGLLLAAGVDAKGALRALIDAPGKENLGSRVEAKEALFAMGDQVAFMAFVDPIRLLARQAGKSELGPSAPIVFAMGKGGEGVAAVDPWMRLDVANIAIQELVKRRGAF